MAKQWYEKLKAEEIAWLSQQLLEGRFPVAEICKLFTYKFPKSVIGFSDEDLRTYAKRTLTGWSEDDLPETIEDEIEKESQLVDLSDPNLLNVDDEKKVISIITLRIVLGELWYNYRKLIEGGSDNENAKMGYLDKCSREIEVLRSLEESEKSLVSMLDEVRKAEEKESAEDLLDYVIGYCWPMLVLKVGDGEEISKEDQAKLKELYLKLKEKTVFTFTILENGVTNKSEVNKIYMRKLYEYKGIAPSSSDVDTKSGSSVSRDSV